MRSFPFAVNDAPLVGDDLQRLAVPFARAVSHFFPSSRVALLPLAAGTADRGVEPALRRLRDRGRPALSADGATLLLPVWREDEVIGAAVLSHSELPLADMSSSWLLEVSRILSREFQLIKQWSLDAVTGLPNGQQLREALVALLVGSTTGVVPAGAVHVVLMEIYPTARDGEQAQAQAARAASSLEGLVGAVAPLYACGVGVFGAIWQGFDTDRVLKMGEALLRRLKRDNFGRVHLGITSLSAAEASGASAATLLDQAWEALHAARRRGPHALCTHAALSRLQTDHPFGPPTPEVTAELRRQWRGVSRFAVVLVRGTGGAELGRRLATLVGPSVPLVAAGDGEAYVFLAGADRDQALAWAGEVRRKTLALDGGVAVGIALYPCSRYPKAALPVNARKALRHAGFFEDHPVAVFDAVSCNISGDVYYNDGDLARAVREYRQGLAFDGESVNLLNSLAVVYVQMNRYRDAIPLFEKAAALDTTDFMAPFNLAFAYLEQGRVDAAIAAFEKALAIDPDSQDVLLQLGELYGRRQRFAEAAALLERLAATADAGRCQGVGGAAVQLALAEAYRGLCRNREAIACLERAVRFHPRDGIALSLLGELYAEERQGDDIALSLCRQAVELDDRRWQPWYRLGLVQARLGDLATARASLRRSLALDQKNPAVLYRLGRLYEAEHQGREARRLFERVLRLAPAHAEAAAALERVRQTVAKKRRR